MVGDTTATGDLDAIGMNLTNNTADVTIGDAGNIQGLAVIGELDGLGQLANAVSLTATTTDGAATATGDFEGVGIQGVDGGTLLTAGPSDGDITGSGAGRWIGGGIQCGHVRQQQCRCG